MVLWVKKTKKKKKLKSTVVSFFCVITIVFILVMVSKTYISAYEKNREREVLTADLAELRKEEAQLVTDVAKLKDPDYVARFLREKFFYSTNGEYIIRLPE